MITVNIYYTGKDGSARAFAEEMLRSGTVSAIRAEDGCLLYEYRPEEGPENELHLYEKWVSPEHQKVHMTQPHMKDILAIQDQFAIETKLINL